MNSLVDQSGAAGHPAGGDQQPQHLQAAGRRAHAADAGRSSAPRSTSSAMPCTGCFPTSPIPRFSGTSCRGTSWNTRRRSTKCGSCGPRCWPTTPATTPPASRCRRTSWTGSTQSRLWGEGFATTEYLGAALLDLAWHVLEAGSVPEDALEFEAKALAAAGVAHPPDSAALPDGLLPAHLRRRRLRGRLLLLHLERGTGRRNRGLVHRKRRAQPGQRRPFPRRTAFPRQQPGPAGVLPHPPRTRRRPWSRC